MLFYYYFELISSRIVFSSILFVNDINTKSQKQLPQSTTTQSFQPTTPAMKNNRKIKIITKRLQAGNGI